MLKIRLLKDWHNDGVDYKAGHLLQADQETVDILVAEGIAELYTPKGKTVVVADAEPEPDVDAIKTIVADAVKESIKTEMKDLKIPAEAKGENKSPWSSVGEFFQSVKTGLSDNKLATYCNQKITGMGEAINADGGFLIPQEFSTAILDAMNEQGQIAPRCLNFPVNNNLSLPFVNNTTQATSWTGGVTVYKPSEGSEKTASQPALAKCELKLNKMTALVYATDELLQDSPVALERFLTTMVASEFALTKDEDIINGSGAGEALGIMNAPATVSVAKESGQAADTIEYANVAKMWSRLYAPSMRRAVWLISQDSMEQISQLSVVVGTGGAPVMVINAATQMPQTLFGAPIIWSPHCQTIGDTGDIILADLSQYVTVTKQGRAMETATSIHVKFVYDETAFRFVVRFDGQPWWASARTPKHGSNTVSPFVKLDERA